MPLSLISSALQITADGGRDSMVVHLHPGLQRSPTAFGTHWHFWGWRLHTQANCIAGKTEGNGSMYRATALFVKLQAKPTGWKEILKDKDCIVPGRVAAKTFNHLSPVFYRWSRSKKRSIWGVTKYILLRICKSLGQEFRPLEKYPLQGRKRKTQRPHWFWDRGCVIHISLEAHSAL